VSVTATGTGTAALTAMSGFRSEKRDECFSARETSKKAAARTVPSGHPDPSWTGHGEGRTSAELQ
jgi:hypothetical protein